MKTSKMQKSMLYVPSHFFFLKYRYRMKIIFLRIYKTSNNKYLWGGGLRIGSTGEMCKGYCHL